MKKLVLLVALVSIAGFASANLLSNGDFEAGDDGSWSKWWEPGNGLVDAVDPIDGDLCGLVWWTDWGMYQGIPIGSGLYEVSGEMLNLSTEALGSDRIAVIKAEMGDGVNIWWTQEFAINAASPQDEWLFGSFVVDNTGWMADPENLSPASYMNIQLFMFGGGEGDGNARYDNISVTVIPEPATLGLLGLAGAALFIRRRLMI